jgi:hypothetical protein
MGLNYYASSPVVVLPPQQPSTYFGGPHNFSSSPSSVSPTTSDTLMGNVRPSRPKFAPRPPSLNYLASSPKSMAGRKRSRDDTAETHESLDDGSYAVQAPPPKPRGEPIYGPGMTLVYPDDPGFHIAVGSQTGTWAEEREAKEKASARPIIISRKSQRLVGDIKLRDPFGEPIPSSSWPSSDSDVHTIDRMNLALGIGWKRIPSELAPASAGWEKFIANHYRLDSPTILLQHEGLKVFLVYASRYGQSRFWVFQDDLRMCQCVGATEEVAIAALTHMEPDQDGIMRNRILTEGEPLSATSRSVSSNDLFAQAAAAAAATPLPQPADGDMEMEF